MTDEPTSKPEFVPLWISADIVTARNVYGLDGDEWNMEVKMTSTPNGDSSLRGSCTAQPFNHSVLIELSSALEHDLDGTKTVFHEVEHWSMAEIDVFVEALIGNVENHELREHLLNQWGQIVESYVSRTSRRLVEIINDGIA